MAAEPATLAALSLGAFAHRLFAAGGRGRVIAAFRRALYVAGPGGMACLGAPAIGEGPLNVPVAVSAGLDWRALGTGRTVAIDAAGLDVAGGPAVAIAGAALWRPPPIVGSGLGRGLAALAVRARPPDEGLGFALPALAGGRPLPPGTTPFRRAARRGLAALADWLGAGSRGAPAAAAGLIGLGPGLTPAGDDALGGAMIALRGLGRVEAADRLGAWCLSLAARRTSAIARAHLAAAAEGEGAAALHAVLATLASGDGPELARALPALGRLGHSSGWDALAGAVLVLRGLAGGDDPQAELGGERRAGGDDDARRLERGALAGIALRVALDPA